MLEIRKTMLSPSVINRTLRECSLSTTFEMKSTKSSFDFPIVIHYIEVVDDKPNGVKWLSHVVINKDSDNSIYGGNNGPAHYDFWDVLNTALYDVLETIARKREHCGNKDEADDLNDCCDIIFDKIETTMEYHGIHLEW